MFNRNMNQPTQDLYLYTSSFSSGLRCNTQCKRPSLEESFIMHSRLGLACSHAPSHSLCELPPLKPPLIVLGTVVQVFSSLRGLCSMLPWHAIVTAPRHVPLLSSSASSASVLVLCDASGGLDIRRGPLSSTCGLVVSARIASPCFPRPRSAGTLVARSAGLRQTSSTIIADSPIIRHDVLDVAPSTPYFSSPMAINHA